MEFHDHLKAVKKKNPALCKGDDEKAAATIGQFTLLLENAYKCGYNEGLRAAGKATPSLFETVFGKRFGD